MLKGSAIQRFIRSQTAPPQSVRPQHTHLRFIRGVAQKILVFTTIAGVLWFGVFARKAHAQEAPTASDSGIRVETSPQVFAVMCALDAAGFDDNDQNLVQMPARLALHSDLVKMQGPATEAVRQFYRDHALADPTETLSPFMTYALSAGPPPVFELRGTRESLPPAVLSIDGFQDILAKFYQEAHLETRWAKIEPETEPVVEDYREVLRRIVMVSDGYLREITKPVSDRTFTVYVEPLVGLRTNFRNSGDHYAIVVGSVSDLPLDEIQHAYLHFMIDPLVLRNQKIVFTKAALLNDAARAPQLPAEYHDDFIALTDECLIKAVELRLRHLSGARLEEALKDEDQSGFILVRPFVAQLQKFEKEAPAMSYYFPDLITGLDVQAEQKRLLGFTFASADAAPAPEIHGDTSQEAPPSELERWLNDGNRAIARQDAASAVSTFETALAKYPNDLRALYGLAIASVLSGQADRAKDLFAKIVSAPASTPPGPGGSAEPVDPGIVAWSHVYLGRMHDLDDERDEAVGEYRAALAIAGAPESARTAAQSGVQTAYQPAARPGENKQPQP